MEVSSALRTPLGITCEFNHKLAKYSKGFVSYVILDISPSIVCEMGITRYCYGHTTSSAIHATRYHMDASSALLTLLGITCEIKNELAKGVASYVILYICPSIFCEICFNPYAAGG